MVDIGKKIRQIRQEKGLSVYRVAKDVGLTRDSTLHAIESGASKNPSVYTIKKICDYLEITIDDLLNE